MSRSVRWIVRNTIAVAALGTLFPAGARAAGLVEPVQRVKRPEVVHLLPSSFPVGIRQAAGQPDPTTTLPIRFEVLFTQPIFPSTFDPSDIVQIGTATGLTWVITPLGDDRNFILEATSVAFSPTPVTVIPTIPAGAVATEGACSAASANPGDPCGTDLDCPDGTGTGECLGGSENSASSAIDNSVTYGTVSCATSTYLYVAGWSPPRIYIYCVEATGTLTYQDEVVAPGDTRDLEINPGGQHLYYGSSDLTEYVISLDGSLAPAGTLTIGGGSLYDLTFGPLGRYLYGTHSSGKLYVFDTITALPSPIQVVPGLVSPHGVAVGAGGDYVYVANQWSFLGDPTEQEIVIFPRNGDGTVNAGAAGHTDWLARPDFFAVHPTLPYLYHTDRPGSAVVTGQISGGTVLQGDSDFSGFGATQLALNSAGTRLYVTNYNDADLSLFSVGASGELTFLGNQPTGDRPEHLVLHPSGSFLYVVSSGGPGGSTTVSAYSVLGNGLDEILPAIHLPQGGYRLAIVGPN